MKIKLLSFSDSNMMGDRWEWSFFISRKRDKTYTISCKQTVRSGPKQEIDEVVGLTDGKSVYAAFTAQIEDAGYYFDGKDAELVASRLAELSDTLSKEFLQANNQAIKQLDS